ncbi:MAG: hypothetical protein JW931_03215 [Methanomicrobiaceae archaeon]|nr:hypothetical protein [Methanomicrobiaceae archaeon]
MKNTKGAILAIAILFFLLYGTGTVTAETHDPSITMVPGKSEAVIGETITITGTIDRVNAVNTYLLLSGNGLDEDGVTMVNLNYKASEGRFTEVPVKSDGKWIYQWNTAYIGGFTPGQYTIYAMSGPVKLTELKNSGEIYTSSSIIIKPASTESEPLITITASPSGAVKGNPVRFTGYSNEVNNAIIYLFITGPGIDEDGAPLGDLSAKASEGRFSEVQLTGGSYLYTWDTSVVPPGEYTVYAVTGPENLSKLDTSGNIYAKVSLKVTGEPSITAGTEMPGTTSSTGTEQNSASTPLSLISTACALMLGFAVFGISRK